MDVITLEMTNEKIKEYCHVLRNSADEIPEYVQAIEKELEKEGKNLK